MRKMIRLVIGVNIYALAINLLQSLELGMGSFDSLTLEFQSIFNILEFGNASFLLHFIFFVLLMFVSGLYKIDYKLIFLSLLSIYILTRVVNFYSIFDLAVNRSIFSVIGVILFLNLGLYLIASTNLIIAPFDKFVVETSMFLNFSIGKSRLIFDVTLLLVVIVINFIIVNKIEITSFTFIITFCTGLNMGIYELIEGLIKKEKQYKVEN